MLVVMLQIYNESLVLMHISGLKDAFKVFLFPETHVYQAENKTIKVWRRIMNYHVYSNNIIIIS